MLNFFSSHPDCFVVCCMAFVIIFLIRTLAIHQIKYAVMFHSGLFIILVVLCIGGGGVQNDGYKSLDQFAELENAGHLAQAREHPHQYEARLQADLKQFSSTQELREYLAKHDIGLDRIESILLGWFFVLLNDLSLALIAIIRYITQKLKCVNKL